MSDDLPDLSEFDKYLDDEDLEKLERKKKASSGGSSKGGSGSGGKGGGATRRPRRLLWLLVGLALGVAGTLFLPDLLRPYLPAALRLGDTHVPGLVVDERREGDRLLLTVDTDRGATLATFTRRVPEIDLLVSQGDSVTLGLGEYEPLVEDPSLVGVRKGRAPAVGPPGPESAAPSVDSAGGASEADTTGG